VEETTFLVDLTIVLIDSRGTCNGVGVGHSVVSSMPLLKKGFSSFRFSYTDHDIANKAQIGNINKFSDQRFFQQSRAVTSIWSTQRRVV
jgi:hypothetical protein